MARRGSPVFSCTACGAQSPRWLGRCPECGSWNTLVEEAPVERRAAAAPSAGPSAPVRLSDVDATEAPRLLLGIEELDRVLGGGLVPGSVVLLGGEPGIGKSTLLLQAAASLAKRAGPVLYVSAEESARQVRMRADRLGAAAEGILLLAETALGKILASAEADGLSAVVVDSIQTIWSEETASSPGSVSQVRECASRLAVLAKTRGVPVFLVGHVTKDGTLAGPKTLEHLVDTVLSFEGEKFHAHRVVRALKNRFGPVHELGVFEMTGEGLVEVRNPSSLYLSGRIAGRPGSAVLAAVEGTRPLLVEVQALTVETKYGTPRRTAIGFDGTRLALLLAVLERHGGLSLASSDVFVNVAGGAETEEPAADAAVLSAVAGSARQRPLRDGTVVFGEVGLLGEVRAVTDATLRLKEAASLGFSRVLLPAGNAGEAAAFPDLDAQPVRNVEELLRLT
ncbi:MAG: DNA repair protein RadA [Acidobacteria bacterium]|nr:MAG: DNA repair protein RadA [Acidobacteriota bacterium]MCE7958003.1 DNA repair protein RadA [Acidobacteria bacterium ACB2]